MSGFKGLSSTFARRHRLAGECVVLYSLGVFLFLTAGSSGPSEVTRLISKLPVWGPDHRKIFEPLAGGRDYRENFVRGLPGPWPTSESRSLRELRRESKHN